MACITQLRCGWKAKLYQNLRKGGKKIAHLI